MRPPVLAVDATQWIIAIGSLSSALIALVLALGLKEWIARPRVRLVLRDPSQPDEISDRVVTTRLETGELGAFVRVRVDNRGRSTARNVCVRVLKVHRWDRERASWIRDRPELDGRLLRPSNQLAQEPNFVDVFPRSDRIVDLASIDFARTTDGMAPLFLEISHPWPPNEANALEPGTWQVELMVCGDNVRATRSFFTLEFDGNWQRADDAAIWRHFDVRGPVPESSPPARGPYP